MTSTIADPEDTFTFASEIDQAPIFVRKWPPLRNSPPCNGTDHSRHC
jgi:hypothetical protein